MQMWDQSIKNSGLPEATKGVCGTGESSPGISCCTVSAIAVDQPSFMNEFDKLIKWIHYS